MLVDESPLDDLLGSLDDGVPELVVEQPKLVVHVRRLQLYGADGLDEAPLEAEVAYGEVIQGAAGLGAEEGFARDLDLPHRVSLYAVRRLLLRHVKPPVEAISHIIWRATVALYER
jgi:hypothetical protein